MKSNKFKGIRTLKQFRSIRSTSKKIRQLKHIKRQKNYKRLTNNQTLGSEQKNKEKKLTSHLKLSESLAQIKELKPLTHIKGLKLGAKFEQVRKGSLVQIKKFEPFQQLKRLSKASDFKLQSSRSLLIIILLAAVIAAPVMSQPLGLTTLMTAKSDTDKNISETDQLAVAEPVEYVLAAPENMDLTDEGLSRSQKELPESQAGEKQQDTKADAVNSVDKKTETFVVAYEAADLWLYVSASELNLRQQDSVDAPVLAQVPMGAKLHCIGINDEWLRVEYDGFTGYVVAKYTTDEMVFVPVDQVRYIDASSLNLRSEASAEAEVVTMLSQDTAVNVIGIGDGWSLIKTNGGSEGYVVSEYLTSDVPASVIAAQEAQTQQVNNNQNSAPAVNPGAIVGSADKGSIVDLAWQGLGVRYVGSGSSLNGFDCSGYTAWIYRQVGIDAPNTASAYANAGMAVSMSELQPGDVIAMDARWGCSSAITHVGIYVGGGQMLHASWSRQQIVAVDIGSLESSGMTPLTVRRFVD